MAEWGDGVGRVKQQRFPPFNVRNPRNQLFSVKLRKRRGLAKVIKQKEIKTVGVAGLGSVVPMASKKCLRSAKKLRSRGAFNAETSASEGGTGTVR